MLEIDYYHITEVIKYKLYTWKSKCKYREEIENGGSRNLLVAICFVLLAMDNERSLGRAERSSLQSKVITCIEKRFLG